MRCLVTVFVAFRAASSFLFSDALSTTRQLPPKSLVLLRRAMPAGGDSGGYELASGKSLASIFNLAVACQRAGDHAKAVEYYQTMLDGAEQVENNLQRLKYA